MTATKRLLMLLLTLALLVSTTACGGTPAASGANDPLTVGFIYVGPIGDGGYTYAARPGPPVHGTRTGRQNQDHLP